MPFEASFNDIYKLGIKPAAEGASERTDLEIVLPAFTRFGNLIRANASIEVSLDSSGASGEYLLGIGVTNPHELWPIGRS